MKIRTATEIESIVAKYRRSWSRCPLYPRFRIDIIAAVPNQKGEHLTPDGVFITRQTDHRAAVQHMPSGDIDLAQISIDGDVSAVVDHDHVPESGQRLDGENIPLVNRPDRRAGGCSDIDSRIIGAGPEDR